MKKLLVISLLIIAGCSKKEQPPAYVLPKNDIVDVMIHLSLMEEKIGRMKTPKDSAEQMFDYYRNKILLEKGIDRKQFDDSYNFYLIHDLKGLSEIQKAMVDSLTKYKNTLKTY